MRIIKNYPTIMLLLVALLAAACSPAGAPQPPATFTNTPMQPAETAQPTASLAPEPTAMEQQPSPTPTLLPSDPAVLITTPPEGLPAPLYFLQVIDDVFQIVRLETDATTLTQITSEEASVNNFDIAPAGDKVVYISGNQLIQAASSGDGRTVLVSGPELLPGSSDYRNSLDSPRWSPDGSRIAYAQDGLRVLDLASGENSLIYGPNLLNGGTPVDLFSPHSWTPDGQSIIVRISHFEGSELGLIKAEPGAELTYLEIPACCETAFTREGKKMVVGSVAMTYSAFGLWQVDLESAKVDFLLKKTAREGQFTITAHPSLDPDNHLLLFYAQAENPEEAPLYLVKSTAPLPIGNPPSLIDPGNDLSPVGSQTVPSNTLWDLSWSEDASWVAFQDNEILYLMRAKDGAIFEIGLRGYQPQFTGN